MKILLFSLNYLPELTGTGKYSGEMAGWLQKQGHEVKVITSPPYYPDWKVGKGYRSWQYKKEKIDGVEVNRCPLYVPQQPGLFTRIVHLLSFTISSLPVLFKQVFWKPDIVILIEPTLFAAPGIILFSKLMKAKSILHIQDFEFDAMLGLGIGMSKSNLRAGLFRVIESIIMKGFDSISSISANMVTKAKKKSGKMEQVFYFPNWVDVNFISPHVTDKNYFRKKWNIPDQTKIVLYSGNLGQKQGLDIIIDVAEEMSDKLDVLFVIVGTGVAKRNLLELVKLKGLRNIRFYDLQPYEQLPSLMAFADVHLVIQKKGAADSVLPSKLTTILSIGGHALITAEQNTELGLLSEKYPGVAYRVEPEDSQQLVLKLNEILSQIDINNRNYNQAARGYAEKYLGKDAVLSAFEEKLMHISSPVSV